MDPVREGVARFNSHRFWDAHEAWEEVWLSAEGELRQFLQGLIQLAAAYHHIARGTSTRGAIRLFDAGLRRLEPIPHGYGGVDRREAEAGARRDRARLANGEPVEIGDAPKLHLVT